MYYKKNEKSKNKYMDYSKNNLIFPSIVLFLEKIISNKKKNIINNNNKYIRVYPLTRMS